MDFNIIDGIVLLILAFSFFKGFNKGFVIIVASFVALVAGVIGAMYFSDLVAIWLQSKVEIDEEYISITSFTLTFVGILIGVNLVGKIIDQAVKVVALGPLNKIMGGAFSVLKTILILSVAFYIFDFANNNIKLVKKQTLNSSYAYTSFRGVTEFLIPIVTKSDWYNPDRVEEFIDDLKEDIPIEIE